MRAHTLVATPVRGPLTADQLTAILKTFRSIHQFQPFDQFSVVYISEQLVLQLYKGAMESLVEYLEGRETGGCKRTKLLANLADRIIVQPVPEPEVLAARPIEEPEPEPDFDLVQPKFIARVRFKLLNGRRVDETRAIDHLHELESILEDGPYDEDIKHIKIKLEIHR